MAKVLLDLLRRICPEARPVRFGTFEPMQNRLETGTDEPFVEMWSDLSQVEWGDSFFWTAKAPCFGGWIFFPDQREQYDSKRVNPGVLSLSFDGSILHVNRRWYETVVTLFTEIAQTFDAFYALGYVQRDVIVHRGKIWLDGRSESGPILPGRWWMGLSPTPTWLAWFGEWYARELEPFLTTAAAIRTPEGIFLRLGPEPLDRDQLREVFPSLPPYLLVQQAGAEYKPAEKLPNWI
jgi:hypothetical protein